MIQHTHRVEKFILAGFQSDPHALGLLGTGMCLVDGIGVGPFIIVRDVDGVVSTSYMAPFEALRIPDCLQSPEVREQIESMVGQAMAEWEARKK